MRMVVSAQYAAEHFEELASAADRGEEVQIARNGKPALTLIAKRAGTTAVRPRSELFGSWRGRAWMSPDFDSPETNKEIEDEFLNGSVFPAGER